MTQEERDAIRQMDTTPKAPELIPGGFVPPFAWDGAIYIFDSASQMAATDYRCINRGWEARGWGRIGNWANANATMNAWVDWFKDAVGDDCDGAEAARRMNEKAGHR